MVTDSINLVHLKIQIQTECSDDFGDLIVGELKQITFKEFITLQRGFDLPKRNMKPGIQPVIGSTSTIGYHDEFKVNPPGVVMGRSGALGSVQYIPVKYCPHNPHFGLKISRVIYQDTFKPEI